MVDSTINIQSKQRDDVTPQIVHYHQLYGGSDNTNPATLVSSRSLNYASGSTTRNPTVVPVSLVPQSLNYKDTVGLFGVENAVLRFDLQVQDSGSLFNQGPNSGAYVSAVLTEVDEGVVNTYEQAVIDPDLDLEIVNTFEPAKISAEILTQQSWKPVVSVELIHNKTGNQYNDCWLDVTLLDHDRKPLPGDAFYTPLKSTFYVSVAARNTRRLPYDFTLVIGRDIESLNQLTPRQINEGNDLN